VTIDALPRPLSGSQCHLQPRPESCDEALSPLGHDRADLAPPVRRSAYKCPPQTIAPMARNVVDRGHICRATKTMGGEQAHATGHGSDVQDRGVAPGANEVYQRQDLGTPPMGPNSLWRRVKSRGSPTERLEPNRRRTPGQAAAGRYSAAFTTLPRSQPPRPVGSSEWREVDGRQLF